MLLLVVCGLPCHGQATEENDDPIFLGKFLHPWELGDPNELVEFAFDDADLSSFISYIEHRYQLTFIMDDALKPLPKDGKSALGTKITFQTHEPLSKKDAWAVFLTFLDMAGLTTVPGPSQGIYRITTIDPKSALGSANSPLPTFIGINPAMLPDNDTHVRYVYFVKDANIDIIKNVLDTMKSATAPALIVFPEVRGIIITDKSYNIKAMLEIVEELDKVTMPETLSIIKLKRTDATKVAKLYKELVKEEDNKTLASRLLGSRKEQTMSYFPSGAQVIPEPRTNTLILLGSQDAVQKIENFILREIDKDIELPYSPMHVYTLKYTQAEAVAQILSEAIKFQPESAAAKAGGVRSGDKYLKPVSITPEKSGNRLIIVADYEDYLKIHEILKKIDVEQPQVAIKVLIVSVNIDNKKELGAQIRSKKPGVDGLLSDNINYQTSGLGFASTSSVQENSATNSTGATRLLGDLVNLARGGTIGSTYITMGSDCFGVWGMLRFLDTYAQTNIISNPFLVTTNNYPAQISLGETRRVVTGTTFNASGQAQNSFGDIDAKVSVSVTPQISYEGFITLDVVVQNNEFTDTASDNGNRVEREIRTAVILANNGVLALGGLVGNTFVERESKVPILGEIPLLGWFFKNKAESKIKTSILILISPEIIPVESNDIANKITAIKIKDSEETMQANDSRYTRMDPIHRWFFNDAVNEGVEEIENYIAKEERYLHPAFAKQQTTDSEGRTKKRLSDFL